MRTVLALAASVTALAVAGAAAGGVPVLPGTTAQDFALRDQNGRVIRLSQQRGHVVLLTFLYTRCPAVCPLLASNLNTVLRSLRPQELRRVRVLAVSVDPAHDTTRAVRAFVRLHALLPQFHYLVGSRSDLLPVWQAYNLLVEVQSVERVSHSAYVLLIDRTGRPRIYYRPSVHAPAVLRDLRRFGVR